MPEMVNLTVNGRDWESGGDGDIPLPWFLREQDVPARWQPVRGAEVSACCTATGR
jgi:hypothetical protein